MDLPCSACGEPVPVGAKSCPACGAGLGTVMFGKNRGLSRTLISKALELRNSIPWASASAVILLDRKEGGRRLRPLGVAALVFVLAAAGFTAWSLRGHHRRTRAEATLAQALAPSSAPEHPEPAAAPEPHAAPIHAIRPEHPAAVASTHPGAHAKSGSRPASSARAAWYGTLVVNAYFKGKPIKAKVLVNGDDKGTTPVRVALVPNRYTLTVEKAGFKREKRPHVAVHLGQTSAVRVELHR